MFTRKPKAPLGPDAGAGAQSLDVVLCVCQANLEIAVGPIPGVGICLPARSKNGAWGTVCRGGIISWEAGVEGV